MPIAGRSIGFGWEGADAAAPPEGGVVALEVLLLRVAGSEGL